MRKTAVFLFLVCFCAALCFSPPLAIAHPHAWIDYQIDVLTNEKNELVGLREHWLFDPFYTAFALKDFAATDQAGKETKKNKDQILMDLAQDNLQNLIPYHYFTEISVGKGKSLPLKPFEDVSSHLEKDQIAMTFTVRLVTPVSLKGSSVQYRIYDPSYYIAMRHQKTNPVSFEGAGGVGCRADIVTPKPDLTHLNLASSLDQKAVAPPDLGGYFAQRTTLLCP